MADIILTNEDDTFNETLAASTVVYGLDGNDQIDVTTYSRENDTDAPDDKGITIALHGGAGNDQLSIYGAYSQGVILGGDGNDTINLFAADYTGQAHGGAGNDYLNINGDAFGDAGDDVIYAIGQADGGDGADILYGEGADGGDGDDVVEGESGVTGGSGSDELWSNNVAIGGDGNDVLFGADNSEGGAGHDVFAAYVSPDRYDVMALDFEQGIDRFSTQIPLTVVDAFTGTKNEVISTGTEVGAVDLDGDSVADTYIYTGLSTIQQSDLLFASFLGGSADEGRQGGRSAELIMGRGGNDILGGGGADDWLFGGFGQDRLSGDQGNDLLVGNSGADVLNGGAGDDELDGGEGNDTLIGGIGNDYIYAGANDDIIKGGTGADRLLGDLGNDRISGDAGDDIIVGGAGKDVLIGGVGSDIFVFNAGDSGVGGANRDFISDFQVDTDKIDLTSLGDGLAYDWTQQGDKALLRIDADHNGSFEMQITIGFASGSSFATFDDSDLLLA